MSYITQRDQRCGGFVRNDSSKPTPRRTEGRIKRFDSCIDARAWNVSGNVRSTYLIDYVNNLPRTRSETADVGVDTSTRSSAAAVNFSPMLSASDEIYVSEPDDGSGYPVVSNIPVSGTLESRFDSALRENKSLRQQLSSCQNKLRKIQTQVVSVNEDNNLNVPSEYNRLEEKLLKRDISYNDQIETYKKQLEILKNHCKVLQSVKNENDSLSGLLSKRIEHENNSNVWSVLTLSSPSNANDSTDVSYLQQLVAELRNKVSSLHPVKKERDGLRNEIKRLNNKIDENDKSYSRELNSIIEERNELRERLHRYNGVDNTIKKLIARVKEANSLIDERESLLTELQSIKTKNKKLMEEKLLLSNSILVMSNERDMLLSKLQQSQEEELQRSKIKETSNEQSRNLERERDVYKTRYEELHKNFVKREKQLWEFECTISDRMEDINTLNKHLKRISEEKNQLNSSLNNANLELSKTSNELGCYKAELNNIKSQTLPIKQNITKGKATQTESAGPAFKPQKAQQDTDTIRSEKKVEFWKTECACESGVCTINHIKATLQESNKAISALINHIRQSSDKDTKRLTSTGIQNGSVMKQIDESSTDALNNCNRRDFCHDIRVIVNKIEEVNDENKKLQDKITGKAYVHEKFSYRQYMPEWCDLTKNIACARIKELLTKLKALENINKNLRMQTSDMPLENFKMEAEKLCEDKGEQENITVLVQDDAAIQVQVQQNAEIQVQFQQNAGIQVEPDAGVHAGTQVEQDTGEQEKVLRNVTTQVQLNAGNENLQNGKEQEQQNVGEQVQQHTAEQKKVLRNVKTQVQQHAGNKNLQNGKEQEQQNVGEQVQQHAGNENLQNGKQQIQQHVGVQVLRNSKAQVQQNTGIQDLQNSKQQIQQQVGVQVQAKESSTDVSNKFNKDNLCKDIREVVKKIEELHKENEQLQDKLDGKAEVDKEFPYREYTLGLDEKIRNASCGRTIDLLTRLNALQDVNRNLRIQSGGLQDKSITNKSVMIDVTDIERVVPKQEENALLSYPERALYIDQIESVKVYQSETASVSSPVMKPPLDPVTAEPAIHVTTHPITAQVTTTKTTDPWSAAYSDQARKVELDQSVTGQIIEAAMVDPSKAIVNQAESADGTVTSKVGPNENLAMDNCLAELAKLRAEKQKLVSALESATKQPDLSDQIMRERMENERLLRKTSDLKKQLTQISSPIPIQSIPSATALSQIKSITAELSAADDKIKDLKAEVDKFKKMADDCQKKLAASNNIEQDANGMKDLASATKKANDLANENTRLASDNKKLSQDLDDLRKRLAEMEKTAKTAADENAALKKLIDDKMNEIKQIEKDCEKKLDDAKRKAQSDIATLKAQFDRDVANVKQDHKAGVDRMQSVHEDIVQETIREHSIEINNIQIQNDLLHDEVRKHKTCICGLERTNRELLRELNQCKGVSKTIEFPEKECTCPNNLTNEELSELGTPSKFEQILNKINNEGLESLTMDDLRVLHTKICKVTSRLKGVKDQPIARRLKSRRHRSRSVNSASPKSRSKSRTSTSASRRTKSAKRINISQNAPPNKSAIRQVIQKQNLTREKLTLLEYQLKEDSAMLEEMRNNIASTRRENKELREKMRGKICNCPKNIPPPAEDLTDGTLRCRCALKPFNSQAKKRVKKGIKILPEPACGCIEKTNGRGACSSVPPCRTKLSTNPRREQHVYTAFTSVMPDYDDINDRKSNFISNIKFHQSSSSSNKSNVT